MKRNDDWLYEFVVITLGLILILALFSMLRSIIHSIASDAETQAIMEAAQERIDAFEAVNDDANDKPVLVTVAYVQPELPPVEPVEDWYIESIPLDKDLQKVVFDACAENGVDYFIVLGLIQVESNFQVDAVNDCSGCFGPMQLNPAYFPSDLTPEENIKAGVEYLRQLIIQCEDISAALTAYNAGHDTGNRFYANAVLNAGYDIMWENGVYTD